MLMLLLMFFTCCYFILFLLIVAGIFRSRFRSDSENAFAGTAQIFVSVVIAMRNESLRLPPLLESLASQHYPGSLFEVLFCDDDSEDNSIDMVKEFAKRFHNLSIRVLSADEQQHVSGKKAALTRGIREARGKIVLLSDADTRMWPGWIAAMVLPFRDPHIHMVLGPVFIQSERKLITRFQALESFGIMGITAGFSGLGWPVSANGANMAFRNDSFDMAGGYRRGQSYASGDDQFLMLSFRKRFGKESVVFQMNPAGEVCTGAALRFPTFLQQRLRWISKSSGYREFWVIGSGLISAGFPILILTCLIVGILTVAPAVLLSATGAGILKMLFDLVIVYQMRKMCTNPESLVWFVPAQIFQMLYIPLLMGISLFVEKRWKGRRLALF
jgi:cellulose synthase/poly-beta-1,6-N-acetylglucosamine synthase-like glycosyltransferase